MLRESSGYKNLGTSVNLDALRSSELDAADPQLPEHGNRGRCVAPGKRVRVECM